MSIKAPTLDIVDQANLVTRVHDERAVYEDLTSMVKQHLLGSSICIRNYEPLSKPEDRRSTKGTFIIWARSGLADTMHNPNEVEEVSRGLSIDPIGKNVIYGNDIDMRTFLFSKRYHLASMVGIPLSVKLKQLSLKVISSRLRESHTYVESVPYRCKPLLS